MEFFHSGLTRVKRVLLIKWINLATYIKVFQHVLLLFFFFFLLKLILNRLNMVGLINSYFFSSSSLTNYCLRLEAALSPSSEGVKSTFPGSHGEPVLSEGKWMDHS